MSGQQRVVVVLAPALEMRNEAMTGSNNLNVFMFLSMLPVRIVDFLIQIESPEINTIQKHNDRDQSKKPRCS